MSDDYRPPHRSWPRKFADAFSGAAHGIQGQSSFYAHFVIAAAVIVLAALLQVSRTEWCLLVLCIASVLAAEMFNSALETLAKAVDHRHNLHLESALNIGSAAVLIAAMGAATVGAVTFLPRLAAILGGGN
jgi:diacylglycerol kinase